MYAEVVLSKASRNIDKIFHYSVPDNLEGMVSIGSQVLVPFGRRRDVGYVVGLLEKSEVKGIKDIIAVTSDVPLFTEKQVELVKWMADYYCSFLSTALKCVLPPGGKIRAAAHE